MGLPKGRTNNPKGRKRGSENKVTKELKELIKEFLDRNFAKVQKGFDKLDTKEQLYFYKDMLKYAIPTLQAQQIGLEVDSEEKFKHLQSKQMTPEELKVFNDILEKNV